LNFHRSSRIVQRLHIGIHHDKIHTFDACLNHSIDRVAAAAADPDYDDFRACDWRLVYKYIKFIIFHWKTVRQYMYDYFI
jgi:hypothetical protein